MALGDPTSILYRVQLQFFPIDELAFGKTFVRQLYSRLAEPGGYAYDDINFNDGPPTLSTKRMTHRGSGRSTCKISEHVLIIEESEPEVDLPGFVEVVETVLAAISEVKEDCPPIIGQRCTIQCVAKPLNSEHSISLLAGKVSNVLDRIDPFERPPAFFGIRFRFPPFIKLIPEDADKNDDESPAEERHDFIALRFETWGQDVEQVWMEVVAQYVFQEAIELSNTSKIRDNITDSYNFLTMKGISFLNQFDTPDDRDKETDAEDE
ncbi:MAG: hypothetical protein WD648_03560 [Planctomycetaceae bacterium]